ncbi:MAG: pitrilysin family protein, partial [Candidatus Competibacteraceae bacterium]|nr:pitrilysin family protein [Candidatus Competibacteraceae bacterium]
GALPDLLETLTDMLLTPRFDDQALARERTNLAQERDGASPPIRLEDAAAALAWGNHPLGRPLTGIPKDLEGLKAPELQAYRHSLMQGRRLVVVAAGAVDHDRLLTACGALESLPTGRPPSSAAPHFHPGHHRRSQNSGQTRLRWAWPVAPAADTQGPALELACHCLGGGPSARLHQQLVVQRGLAYRVDSWLERYGDWGLWWLEVDCPTNRTGACQRLVTETLEELAAQGPGGEELTAARRRRIAQLLLEADDPRSTLERLAREAIYRNRVQRIELPLFELEQVDGEQVRAQLARLGEGLMVEWAL